MWFDLKSCELSISWLVFKKLECYKLMKFNNMSNGCSCPSSSNGAPSSLVKTLKLVVTLSSKLIVLVEIESYILLLKLITSSLVSFLLFGLSIGPIIFVGFKLHLSFLSISGRTSHGLGFSFFDKALRLNCVSSYWHCWLTLTGVSPVGSWFR